MAELDDMKRDAYIMGALVSDLEGFLKSRATTTELSKEHVRALLRRLSEYERLREELKRERLRLSACGVAALANTPEDVAKYRFSPDNPYYSASYADVCAAVDREMALREERDELRGYLQELRIHYHTSGRRPEECYEMSLIDEALRARTSDGR